MLGPIYNRLGAGKLPEVSYLKYPKSLEVTGLPVTYLGLKSFGPG